VRAVTTGSRAYVDLFEAIRVVVRLRSDGRQLAAVMTDNWIKGGYWRWNGKADDDPTMIDLYGREWRTLLPKVLRAYGAASSILETMLPTGRIGGVGVSCAKEAEGPRKIEPFEWSSLQLELMQNLLATPVGKRLEDFPAIRSVRVCAEDLRRECADAMTASDPDADSIGPRRGRPRKAVWDKIDALFDVKVKNDGVPNLENSEGWRIQADVGRWIEGELLKLGSDAAESTVRAYAKAMIERRRQAEM
jgi:hypothetical protein